MAAVSRLKSGKMGSAQHARHVRRSVLAALWRIETLDRYMMAAPQACLSPSPASCSCGRLPGPARPAHHLAASRRHEPDFRTLHAAPCWHRRRRFPPPPAARAEQQAATGRSPSSRSSGDGAAITTVTLAKLRYASPDGLWVVRPLQKQDKEEVRRIVALQTDAFYTPAPVSALDGMAKKFFEAEVLSEMQKKLKFNPEELFCSLVIEPTQKNRPSSSSSSSSSNGSSSSSSNGSGSNGSGSLAANGSSVVGVVEISYINSRETLKRLDPGTEGYCYVASMVVAPGWRRRGAAQALLRAAELAAQAWDERQTVLHVYQDNEPAVQLYRQAGYEVIFSQNKLWAAVGSRPRFLMRKRF